MEHAHLVEESQPFTVARLIEVLSEFPSAATVVVRAVDGAAGNYRDEATTVWCSPEIGPVVFIEGD